MKKVSPFSQAVSAVSSNPLNFTKFDEITQSLNGMSLESLATTAKMYPQLRNIILTDFILGKFRLNESRIDIDLQWPKPNILHGTAYIGYGVDETLSVLELFGHVFTQLEIDVNLPLSVKRKRLNKSHITLTHIVQKHRRKLDSV